MAEIPTLKKSFEDKVSEKIEEIVTLKITTIVGTEEKGKKIQTTIDMIQGDIKTVIDEDFLKDDTLKPIYNFHSQREKQGTHIVKENISAIKEVISLADMLTDKLK